MSRIDNIAKSFEPKEAEERIYSNWLEKNYFHAKPDPEKEPYTIVIPPPNITGQLHMGHALDNTLQDILIRWKRMQGYSALWMPGTDHASIATEAKIVEAMAEEGVTKEEIGREKFLERAWEWKKLYGGRIVEQLKRLGSSCDWERERFTMDKGLSDAVTKVFIDLYNKGLIYRGERIINWCPECLTSISDAEVEHEENEGFFWHIRYPMEDGSGEVVVATTRPETMLGDVAVAVNPSDERYKSIVGKKVILPIVNKSIPVIEDDYVESDFGTGIVKITPAHDPNDFEIGLRHDLEIIDVMDERAKMNEAAGKFKGLDRYEARKRIVDELKKGGYIVKIENHKKNVGNCYRCSTTVEPRVSFQWFVRMKPLAGPAIDAVRSKEVEFIPERFDKIYYNWMENIKDWCISRQLWWGHPIPAYYCDSCDNIMVSENKPDECPVCNSKSFRKDQDTLDTWFSSALWPFSTLGWPEKTPEYKYFYPTSVLVTGYDIIFFWVARMIFSAIEHTGEVPFRGVLIHGIVRDEKGKKMSKSLGNGIDPLEIIDEFGADALRYSLINGNSPGNDQRFLPIKVEAGRNFSNKIWNAFRFVLMNFEDELSFDDVDFSKFAMEDKWILTRLNELAGEVTHNLEKYELGVALSKIYSFIWEEFCDWYIEMVKPRLFDKESETRKEAQFVLNHVLCVSMQLLHPYMPYITEEIYSNLIHSDESIMISRWPEVNKDFIFREESEKAATLMEIIRKIRNIRSEMNVTGSKKSSVITITENDSIKDMIIAGKPYIERLAAVNNISFTGDRNEIPATAVAAVFSEGEIFIPLEDLIDIDKEIDRLKNESESLEKEISRVENKLSNEKFVSKAPESVVQSEKEKKIRYTDMKKSLDERISVLEKI